MPLTRVQDASTTIVLAEDDDTLRMLAVEFLTDFGFVVIEAPHASAALAVLEVRHQDIHVLFTDINMPGDMNGLVLAHHVKRAWPKIGLIITSGDRLAEPRKLPEGSRFLRKPYNHEEVIHHVGLLKAT